MAAITLRAEVTCPHCWHKFRPEEVLWISDHHELVGDPLLGKEAQRRFKPTRFTVDGRALDIKGKTCQRLACPKCHLSIPRAFLEMEPLFVSIVGAPSSGKSYFLASMTWQLRKTLQDKFLLSFGDADPYTNRMLSDYEETLFLNPKEDEVVGLRKTELEGDLYESVQFGDQQVWYPRPFVFSVQPQEQHPRYKNRERLSRALTLYDNAGEHFLPRDAEDTVANPGTHHLACSKSIIFLFDPTQHPVFRKHLRGKSDDPQMSGTDNVHRQDQILIEAAARIRAYSQMPENEKYPHPLIVILTKFDAWNALFTKKVLKLKWIVRRLSNGTVALDVGELKKMSGIMRDMLKVCAPEMIAAAEGFGSDVLYMPVSALGCGPEITDTGGMGIRPRDIAPQWAEVPLLYAIQRIAQGLVPAGSRKDKPASGDSGIKQFDESQAEARAVEAPETPAGQGKPKPVAPPSYALPPRRETG